MKQQNNRHNLFIIINIISKLFYCYICTYVCMYVCVNVSECIFNKHILYINIFYNFCYFFNDCMVFFLSVFLCFFYPISIFVLRAAAFAHFNYKEFNLLTILCCIFDIFIKNYVKTSY